MLVGDACSKALGMQVIELDAQLAKVKMTIRVDMINGGEVCHGGIIFSLADSAFAFACNSENYNAVTAGAHIDFLAPALLGDELTATATAINQGKRKGIYDVRVVNQDDRLIALFRGQSHRTGDTRIAQ
ncbi:MAG: hydroxyphenylacetyl-CoA thioesterase PaaI [Pseudomonadota bacterium]